MIDADQAWRAKVIGQALQGMYDEERALIRYRHEPDRPATVGEVRIVLAAAGFEVWEASATVGSETEIYFFVGPKPLNDREPRPRPWDAYLRGRFPGKPPMETAADALDHYRQTHVNLADSA